MTLTMTPTWDELKEKFAQSVKLDACLCKVSKSTRTKFKVGQAEMIIIVCDVCGGRKEKP